MELDIDQSRVKTILTNVLEGQYPGRPVIMDVDYILNAEYYDIDIELSFRGSEYVLDLCLGGKHFFIRLNNNVLVNWLLDISKKKYTRLIFGMAMYNYSGILSDEHMKLLFEFFKKIQICELFIHSRLDKTICCFLSSILNSLNCTENRRLILSIDYGWLDVNQEGQIFIKAVNDFILRTKTVEFGYVNRRQKEILSSYEAMDFAMNRNYEMIRPMHHIEERFKKLIESPVESRENILKQSRKDERDMSYDKSMESLDRMIAVMSVLNNSINIDQQSDMGISSSDSNGKHCLIQEIFNTKPALQYNGR